MRMVVYCIHVAGNTVVSVDTCSNEQYGQCDQTRMKLSEFVHSLEDQGNETPRSNGVILYLKDWHICRYATN